MFRVTTCALCLWIVVNFYSHIVQKASRWRSSLRPWAEGSRGFGVFGEEGCGVEAEDWPARALGSSNRAISDSMIMIKHPGCLPDRRLIVISWQVWLGGPVRAEPQVVLSFEE